MGVGIYHVDGDSFREVEFHSPVSTDRYNRAEKPGDVDPVKTTAKGIMKKYGSGKNILNALLMAPSYSGDINPESPMRMIVIKK
jgi:hypothetical protein